MQLTRLAALAAAALVTTTMATAAGASPTHRAAPTQRIVVRPVTSSNHVANGFTREDSNAHVSCSFNGGQGSVSTVTVDPGVFYCSPDVDYAIACWDSMLIHHVLCFQNAFRHKVVRFRGNAPIHLDNPSHPFNALNLRLGNGEHCSARNGGAVGFQKHHPNWIATYFCSKGGDILWSPPHLAATQGTDRSTPRWHAWVGTASGHLHQRAIDTAYFVGTRG